MHPVLLKTFGGLTKQYYFRQLFFALLIPALILSLMSLAHDSRGTPFSFYIFAVVNTGLYPYSRFVYESVINFIIGENVFYGNAIFLMVIKLFTMMLCWFFAVFIAPIGLIYLYFYHSKTAN